MKPPFQYLNILGVEYSVFWYLIEIPGTEEGEWGNCDNDRRIINVRLSKDHWRNVDTVLHEIGHAIHWEYQMSETENEESFVSKLASGYCKIIQINTHLWEFIGKGYT